jgi:hypothetical protein
MKMSLILTLLLYCLPGLGMSLQDLSKEEIELVKGGELLVKKKSIKNESWAELYVYSYIESTAIEAAAIFAAYDHQQDYVPKMLKSKVLDQPKPHQAIVEYELRLPWPLTNSKYTHKVSLSKLSKDHYKINWISLKSSDTDEMNGEASFINTKEGTLWLYRSFVKPSSFLAGLFERSMVKDVGFSLRAIRKHIQFIKTKNAPLMKKYVEFINKSLAGKFVYRDKVNK